MFLLPAPSLRRFLRRVFGEVLVDLSARVRAYRFRNGHLPKTLAELGKGMDADPLSGGPFVYRRTDAGFEVSSLGDADTGPVELDPFAKKESSPTPAPNRP